MKIACFWKKMVKNQYQEWFFGNSGNRLEKSNPENLYICILDQDSIAFSSKVIGLKSKQNFGHVLDINGLIVPKLQSSFKYCLGYAEKKYNFKSDSFKFPKPPLKDVARTFSAKSKIW